MLFELLLCAAESNLRKIYSFELMVRQKGRNGRFKKLDAFVEVVYIEYFVGEFVDLHLFSSNFPVRRISHFIQNPIDKSFEIHLNTHILGLCALEVEERKGALVVVVAEVLDEEEEREEGRKEPSDVGQDVNECQVISMNDTSQ